MTDADLVSLSTELHAAYSPDAAQHGILVALTTHSLDLGRQAAKSYREPRHISLIFEPAVHPTTYPDVFAALDTTLSRYPRLYALRLRKALLTNTTPPHLADDLDTVRRKIREILDNF